MIRQQTPELTQIVLKAIERARKETSNEPELGLTHKIDWPATCTVGPGLEGAIACETSVGYVNGSKGRLIYQGYDVFDLCARSTFEEVSYLLLHGHLPSENQLTYFKQKLVRYRHLPHTLRQLQSFPVEELNPMAALRLGTLFMRQKLTFRDIEQARPDSSDAIGSDEDSIAMETKPRGEERATYEFRGKQSRWRRPKGVSVTLDAAENLETCYHLISGVAVITAAVARLREGKLPLEGDPDLSHAANFLYMMTGRKPTPEEERVMDIALILHADHGMNASTFAAMVVASTLSDIYFSIGAGIAALNGPLHGGANEQVIRVLKEIGSVEEVDAYVERALARKQRIMGFGHRVYKTYDPRARVLGPLAKTVAQITPETREAYRIAHALERRVIDALGKKGIFPNVDFYSGLVYQSLSIPPELFTPVFAVSRVSGWTARVLEYLRNNRIFRPRAVYVGPLEREYVPMEDRGRKRATSRISPKQ